MNLFKSLFILMIFLVASCKKERPKQVWIYNDHEVTMLNGNVKQISISYQSEPAGFFYRVYFDEQGNLTRSEKRKFSIVQMENVSDSTIENERIQYAVQRDADGRRIAITGSIFNKDYNLTDKSKTEDAISSK